LYQSLGYMAVTAEKRRLLLLNTGSTPARVHVQDVLIHELSGQRQRGNLGQLPELKPVKSQARSTSPGKQADGQLNLCHTQHHKSTMKSLGANLSTGPSTKGTHLCLPGSRHT
jgi:hypothetical protein